MCLWLVGPEHEKAMRGDGSKTIGVSMVGGPICVMSPLKLRRLGPQIEKW